MRQLLKRISGFAGLWIICIGTIKLMPPEHNRQTLMDDYKHMASMIFGNQPSSHELFAKIQRLEDDINFIT